MEDEKRNQMYFDMIREGNRGRIEYALTSAELDEFVSAIDAQGNTILHAALEARYEEMAEQFITALEGARPDLLNAKNNDGWTALSYTLVYGLHDPNLRTHEALPINEILRSERDVAKREANLRLFLQMPGIDLDAKDDEESPIEFVTRMKDKDIKEYRGLFARLFDLFNQYNATGKRGMNPLARDGLTVEPSRELRRVTPAPSTNEGPRKLKNR